VLPLPKRDAEPVDRRIHGRRRGRGGRDANPDSTCQYCTKQHFLLLDFSRFKRRRALGGGTYAHRHDDAGPRCEDRPSDRLTNRTRQHNPPVIEVPPVACYLVFLFSLATVTPLLCGDSRDRRVRRRRCTFTSWLTAGIICRSDRRNWGTHTGCSRKGPLVVRA
jgi:hypothetical protein